MSSQLLSPQIMGNSFQKLAIFKILSFYLNGRNDSGLSFVIQATVIFIYSVFLGLQIVSKEAKTK